MSISRYCNTIPVLTMFTLFRPLAPSVDAATGRLMMLPSDLVLLKDKSFLKWVEAYAKDDAKFDADFTKAFQKLEELGTSNLTPTEWA
jgi:catalase (peroxidase I)